MSWMLSFIDDDFFNKLIKDMKLIILNANKIPILEMTFVGAFPINIPDLSLDSSVLETSPILFTVEFSYQYFIIG